MGEMEEGGQMGRGQDLFCLADTAGCPFRI